MYKNIIIDLDETLIESFKATDRLFEHIVLNNIPGICPKKFRETFRKILIIMMESFTNKQFMKYGIGTYDLFLHPNIEKYLNKGVAEQAKKHVIEKTFKELNLEYTNLLIDSIIKEFQEIWLNYYESIPGTYEVLEKLRDLNFKLYILTNGFRDIQYGKIKKCELVKWFDKVIITEDLGIGKPSAEAFLKLINEEMLEPSDTIMIGDSISSDYLPAREVGIYPILFDRNNKCFDTSINKIKSLNEICKFL